MLGTNCDQCVSMVHCCFTSTETIGLIRTGSPGRLSHSSWTLIGRQNLFLREEDKTLCPGNLDKRPPYIMNATEAVDNACSQSAKQNVAGSKWPVHGHKAQWRPQVDESDCHGYRDQLLILSSGAQSVKPVLPLSACSPLPRVRWKLQLDLSVLLPIWSILCRPEYRWPDSNAGPTDLFDRRQPSLNWASFPVQASECNLLPTVIFSALQPSPSKVD